MYKKQLFIAPVARDSRIFPKKVWPVAVRSQPTPTKQLHCLGNSFNNFNRFVVSEMSGTAQERARFSGGLVFVDPGHLAETCRFYLQRPELRIAIAASGRQIFEQQLEADILREPVEIMLGQRENAQIKVMQNA